MARPPCHYPTGRGHWNCRYIYIGLAVIAIHMMEPVIIDIIHFFSLFFGLVGAVLIIYGGVRSTIEILLLEFRQKKYSYTQVRRELTNKLVFGLEFFIAADVLTTLVTPSTEDILLLGATVAIRVVLGYFLSKEVRDYPLD